MWISALLPLIIVGEGAWLLVRLRAFFILHPFRTLARAFRGEGTGRALAALMLALAGTVGVGNIVGVAVAVEIGGAGSLFWLVLSSVFSSVIKYSEVRVCASSGSRSGMIGVLEGSFGKQGRTLGAFYAALALLLSLTMGSALQASAIKDSASQLYGGMPPLLVAVIVSVTAALVLLGGESIKKAVAFTVPVASILYTGLCLFVIVPNFSRIPDLFAECLREAFTPSGAVGGVAGALTSAAVSRGFAAGLLSNEAGAGTSSFSHTALPESEAARAGIFGIIEVLFDTVFLCTLTGVTLLLGRAESPEGERGIGLLSGIFRSTVGESGSVILLASVVCFAVSTVLCWYYYGRICADRLFVRAPRMAKLFAPAFFASFLLGLTVSLRALIPLTDAVLLCLTVLTAAALVKNRSKLRLE